MSCSTRDLSMRLWSVCTGRGCSDLALLNSFLNLGSGRYAFGSAWVTRGPGLVFEFTTVTLGLDTVDMLSEDMYALIGRYVKVYDVATVF